MVELWPVAILFAWCSFALLGMYAAQQKGRSIAEGLFLALVFGPFGVLVESLLPTLPDFPGGEADEDEDEDEGEEEGEMVFRANK